MPFDESLAKKIRSFIKRRRYFEEKKMFGGLCYQFKGHMCFGIIGQNLMVRVGPNAYENLLSHKHVKVMDFTGKPLKGFIYVLPPGCRSKPSLEKWLNLGLMFVKSLPIKKK